MKKILGFTEDKNTCECCGKENLKGTYAIQLEEGGDFVYYGSVCATKAFGFTSKEFKSADSQYKIEQRLIKKYNTSTYAEALEQQKVAEEVCKKRWAKFWEDKQAA